MKRLTVFVATMVLALLPLNSARAGPTDLPLACGPAGDIEAPTGIALVDRVGAAPVEDAAPLANSDDLAPQDIDGDSISDHDIVLVLGAVLVVLIIAILL